VASRWDLSKVGQTVTCPKCGQPGRVQVFKAKSRGRAYYYLIVRHGEKEKHTVRPLTREEVEEYLSQRPQGPKAEAPRAEEGVEGPKPAPGAGEVQVPITQFMEAVSKLEERLRGLEERLAKLEAERGRPTPSLEELPEEVRGVLEKVHGLHGKRLVPSTGPAELERLAWYLVKVLSSWGTLRATRSQEDLDRFLSNLEELRARGVPMPEEVLRDLEAAAQAYVLVGEWKLRGFINELLRTCVEHALLSYLSQVRMELEKELEAKLAGEVERRVEEGVRARLEERVREEVERRLGRLWERPLIVGANDLQALKKVAIAKRGFTREESERARRVLHEIVARGLEAGGAVILFGGLG